MKIVDFGFTCRGGCSAAVALFMASAAQAAVIVVPTQQPNIQAAINVASTGDTVLVLDGVYTGTGNSEIDLLGKNITLQSQSGPDNCTIDVQATQQNQRGAFYLHMGESHAAVISGFTVRGGLQFNGAGMLMFSSSPTVRNCVFTENQANCWGAVLYFDSGSSPAFIDCKFIDNYSTDDGGAVFGFNGAPSFTNCLFADNEAPSLGGAIFAWGNGTNAVRLTNCTLSGNHANAGAAIYSNNVVIENSILWGNTGSAQIYTFSGANIVVRYSNVQGGWTGSGTGNLNATPGFANDAERDFHLLPGSLCIDAGDPATVVPEGTFDPDGDPRLFGSHIDMGIDEFRLTGDVTGDHVVNVNDLLEVIINWGPCTWSMADLNHDFRVDVDDMLMVLANWG